MGLASRCTGKAERRSGGCGPRAAPPRPLLHAGQLASVISAPGGGLCSRPVKPDPAPSSLLRAVPQPLCPSWLPSGAASSPGEESCPHPTFPSSRRPGSAPSRSTFLQRAARAWPSPLTGARWGPPSAHCKLSFVPQTPTKSFSLTRWSASRQRKPADSSPVTLLSPAFDPRDPAGPWHCPQLSGVFLCSFRGVSSLFIQEVPVERDPGAAGE